MQRCGIQSPNDIRRYLILKAMKQRREEIFERTRRYYDDVESEVYCYQSEVECGYMEEYSTNIEIHNSKLVQYLTTNMKKSPVLTSADYLQLPTPKPKDNYSRKYSRMFQIPDWMNYIPTDLTSFYVMARPCWPRVLVVFYNAKVELRDKSGRLLGTQRRPTTKLLNKTVLEGYFDVQSNSILVSDLLIWKNNPMTSYYFYFRRAWLYTNLNCSFLNSRIDSYHFGILTTLPCTHDTIRSIYYNKQYEKYGLLFVHKYSFYNHGLNLNVLVWKNIHTSKYYPSHLLARGKAILTLAGDIRTLDGVLLGRIRMYQRLYQRMYQRVYQRVYQYSQRGIVTFLYKGIRNRGDSEFPVADVFDMYVVAVKYTRNYCGEVWPLSKFVYMVTPCELRVGIEQICEAVQSNVSE